MTVDMPDDPVRVLLVEDHASFRHALRAVFDLEDGLEIVGEVDDGALAAALAADAQPDVAVVDLDLPGIDGVGAIAAIRAGSPRTACVVLTALEDEAELGRAVEAGANAVLHKSVHIDHVIDVIRRAARGETVLTVEDATRWLRARGQSRDQHWRSELMRERITGREAEILSLLANGGTNPSIAAELGISPETVQTHVRNLLAKMDERSRLELVTTAIRLGLVAPPG